MRQTGLVAAAVTVAQLTAAPARSETIEFSGLIDALCIILVGTAGVLDVSGDGQTISTSYGSAATAVVTTTGTGFDVDVGTPSSFDTAPTDGNAGVTIQTSYTATGVTEVSGILGGVATALGVGVTNVSVDLTATRSDPFPSGTYSTETTITCE